MVVFITGCSKGLGYGLAMHYLQQGHHVYGVSRSFNDELGRHKNFKFLQLDVSNFDQIKRSIPDFIKDESFIDLVILNAGILNEIKDLKETDISEIKHVMDVNVWSNKVLLDTLFSSLKSIKQVVAISSGAAISGSRGWNAYSLSKACLNMLIDLYSKERTDCHFCSLAPGLIETGMQDYLNGIPEDLHSKFPALKRLKNARGTIMMPKPMEAANIVVPAIEEALQHNSGTYLDVREM